MLYKNTNNAIENSFAYIFKESKYIFVIIIIIIEYFIIIISLSIRLINCFKRYIVIKSFLLFD